MKKSSSKKPINWKTGEKRVLKRLKDKRKEILKTGYADPLELKRATKGKWKVNNPSNKVEITKHDFVTVKDYPPNEIQDACSKILATTTGIPQETKPFKQLVTNPLNQQVAGNHYKTMVIQPVEFCQKNRLTFCEASAIKYICRHRNKNGAEDIKKAIHFLELLLELEYATNKPTNV